MAKTKTTPETKTKATRTHLSAIDANNKTLCGLASVGRSFASPLENPTCPKCKASAPFPVPIDTKAKAKASAKAKDSKAPEPAAEPSPATTPAPAPAEPAPVAQEEGLFPMPVESALVAERLTKGSGKSLLIAVFVTAATLARRIEADAPEADIEAALASLMSSIRSAVHAGRK